MGQLSRLFNKTIDVNKYDKEMKSLHFEKIVCDH